MKLEFRADAYYGEVLMYRAGVHEVKEDLGWAQRWINRGAIVVSDDTPLEVEKNQESINTEPSDKKPRRRAANKES